MPNHLTLRGRTGELRKGYQVAAQLGPWSLDGQDRVEAELIRVNEFWIGQGGCDLWLKMATSYWVWREVEIVDLGQSLTLRVHGSPQAKAL